MSVAGPCSEERRIRPAAGKRPRRTGARAAQVLDELLDSEEDGVLVFGADSVVVVFSLGVVGLGLGVLGVLLAGALAADVDERESVMYQPLPLKTMPTGWMTLRRVPPHCSHVVSGGSEKLCRFSITSLQAVQV